MIGGDTEVALDGEALGQPRDEDELPNSTCRRRAAEEVRVTPTVTVVGSGASGVHFALTVLESGGTVRMVDVGRQGRPPVLPEATLTD